jgi:hypothetical protein
LHEVVTAVSGLATGADPSCRGKRLVRGRLDGMSDAAFKHKFPVTWLNLQRYNRRIPAALEREEKALPKKVRKPKVDPIDGMLAVYALLDRYADLTEGVVACKHGCSYCCHSEVAISTLEAKLIASRTGRLMRQVEGSGTAGGEAWIDERRPCPFLTSEGSCSIYGFRPMACRTHYNFEATSQACRFDAPPDVEVPFVDRHKSFPGVMEAWHGLRDRSGSAVADIRDYFG